MARDPEKVRRSSKATRARRIALIGREGESRRQLNVYLKHAYGMTLDLYETKLAEQGGTCAICRRPPFNIRLHVDHNHSTGAVRGLLCRRCNSFVGFLEKHGELLTEAERYLGFYKVN